MIPLSLLFVSKGLKKLRASFFVITFNTGYREKIVDIIRCRFPINLMGILCRAHVGCFDVGIRDVSDFILFLSPQKHHDHSLWRSMPIMWQSKFVWNFGNISVPGSFHWLLAATCEKEVVIPPAIPFEKPSRIAGNRIQPSRYKLVPIPRRSTPSFPSDPDCPQLTA